LKFFQAGHPLNRFLWDFAANVHIMAGTQRKANRHGKRLLSGAAGSDHA
jgi:hypothetical protein